MSYEEGFERKGDKGLVNLVNNHLDSLYRKELKKSSLGLQATQQA